MQRGQKAYGPNRLPAALDAQLQRDAAISHFDYQLLSGLSMSPARTLRMSVLAAFAEGSLSRLSQVVAKLEKRGWVRRAPDPSDGRYTLAILTDDGWAKVVAAAPGHAREVQRLVFQSLTKNQPAEAARTPTRREDMTALRIRSAVEADGLLRAVPGDGVTGQSFTNWYMTVGRAGARAGAGGGC